MFRNYRKCYCMNNSYKNDSCEMQQDIIENQCDNVVSYEEYTIVSVNVKKKIQ